MNALIALFAWLASLGVAPHADSAPWMSAAPQTCEAQRAAKRDDDESCSDKDRRDVKNQDEKPLESPTGFTGSISNGF